MSIVPFLIGVAGGPCSGKSTVCQKIVEDLQSTAGSDQASLVSVIPMENFYKPKTVEQRDMALRGNYNLDHPDAFDEKRLYQTLIDLLAGKTVKIAHYDTGKYEHVEGVINTIEPVPVIIVEGILIFYFPEIRNLFQMKLFVDTDADTRLARRVLRDMKQHGRNLEHVLTGYTNYVKPSFEDFCLPTKKYADVIIPRGADNHVAVDLIVQHIKDFLKSKPKKSDSQPTADHAARARPH
ncbi:unnamed protein product [Rotaria magnacalcarata]|uniref:uridine/cytidine kinase n=1 Tax=Rotaria magnacalcarata TaxID=392030 RepID=A0A816S4C5_9BILA|nr:unnamed protein product [Rotaria magnacalcarata]CAF1581668.1 unnamed protein product [Rotaria magnacalcarata]CAF2076381.1 unnamed protein product [Rotaria magnacalcarata]CAF2080565.1 unnamed protein product [Rotaria magnacalcarata]CAF2085899.1 unnamed protein product [Rotaria magnacalcarata]